MWKLGGPHSKATLTTNMKCAAHYGVLMACVIALPHVIATSTNSFSTLGSNMHLCRRHDILTPNLVGLVGTSWEWRYTRIV